MLPAQPNQSLIDGLSVLQALAGSGKAIGSRELARMLDMEPTRANRLLKTLAAIGVAEQQADRKYIPGPGMHVLSAQSLHGSGLIREVVPHLEKLRQPGRITAMGVLWRDQTCYLYHANHQTPTPMAMGAGELYPASQSGIGRVMLASLSNQQVRDLYHNRVIDGFESVNDLLKELKQIRTQGFAIASPQDRFTTVAVGLGENPTYAAIALSSSQMDQEQINTAIEQLNEVKSLITSQRGEG
jgi:DNA-binding IclR family transcriptional regulator